MENSKRLIDWAISNSKKLNLEVTTVEWINEWLPGYFDYQIKIKLNNNPYTGRGIDINESLAFAKGLAEALERFAVSFLQNRWCSAAYYDYNEAAQRAYYELLTIDRVLCHHFCKKKFRMLSFDEIKLIDGINHLIKMLEKHQLKMGIYELKPGMDAKVVSTLIWSTNPNHSIQGFVAGFGCDRNLKDAIIHSILECLRNAAAIFVGGLKAEPEELFCSPTNPRWHFWQALKKESREYLEKYLIPKPGEEINLEVEYISINDVNFTQINTLNSIFPDIPLVFVQATSDKLIKPQFGKFFPDTHTIKRLKVFNGGPLEIDTNIPPHFYG
jgi:hypothetical protein